MWASRDHQVYWNVPLLGSCKSDGWHMLMLEFWKCTMINNACFRIENRYRAEQEVFPSKKMGDGARDIVIRWDPTVGSNVDLLWIKLSEAPHPGRGFLPLCWVAGSTVKGFWSEIGIDWLATFLDLAPSIAVEFWSLLFQLTIGCILLVMRTCLVRHRGRWTTWEGWKGDWNREEFQCLWSKLRSAKVLLSWRG